MRAGSRGRAGAATLVFAWALVGCAPTSGDGAPVPAGEKRAAAPAPGKAASGKQAAARPPDLAAIESEIVMRVNRYRHTEGLPPLSNDARVAAIARGHSREMASGQTGFGHGGFRNRSQAVAGKIPYSRVAENVARQRRHASAEIPAVAVEGWVGSRGHRHNIEGPYALTGVGAAVGRDGSVYLTQIFVEPR